MGKWSIDDIAIPIIGFSPLVLVVLSIIGALKGC
jgi:hypothetical protein